MTRQAEERGYRRRWSSEGADVDQANQDSSGGGCEITDGTLRSRVARLDDPMIVGSEHLWPERFHGTAVPVLREGRVIRRRIGQIEPTEPAICKVEMHLFSEPTLGPDAHGIATSRIPIINSGSTDGLPVEL